MLHTSPAIDLTVLSGHYVTNHLFLLSACPIPVVAGGVILVMSFPRFEPFEYNSAEPPSVFSRVVQRIIGAAIIALGITFAAILVPVVIEGSAEESAEQARATDLITASLHDRYTFAQLDLAPGEQLGQTWITRATEQDPFRAPTIQVKLEDGSIVEWGVIVDPATGDAEFVQTVDGASFPVQPEDIERTNTE